MSLVPDKKAEKRDFAIFDRDFAIFDPDFEALPVGLAGRVTLRWKIQTFLFSMSYRWSQ